MVNTKETYKGSDITLSDGWLNPSTSGSSGTYKQIVI